MGRSGSARAVSDMSQALYPRVTPGAYIRLNVEQLKGPFVARDQAALAQEAAAPLNPHY